MKSKRGYYEYFMKGKLRKSYSVFVVTQVIFALLTLHPKVYQKRPFITKTETT